MKTIQVSLLIALSTALIAPMPARGDEYRTRVEEQVEPPENPAADLGRDKAAPPPRVRQPEFDGNNSEVEDPSSVKQPPVEQ